MDLLMNGLLTAATVFAGGYCWILARRVRDLKGSTRASAAPSSRLTRQIELARTTLEEARQLVARHWPRAEPARRPRRRRRRASSASCSPRRRRRPPPAGAAAPVPRAVRRAAGTPRARAAPSPATVHPPAEPDPASAPERATAAYGPTLPKPRALAPVENPLRRRERAAPSPAQRGRDPRGADQHSPEAR